MPLYLSRVSAISRPHLLFVGFVLALFTFASNASAMCAYNDMDVLVYVQFECGATCHNDWTLQPNDYACRPSKAGTLYADLLLRGRLFAVAISDPHGYAVISTVSGDQKQVCAYRSDDSPDGDCVPFTYADR